MCAIKNQLEEHLSGLKRVAEKNRFLSSHNHIFESPDFKAIVESGKDEETAIETVRMLYSDLLKKRTWETMLALGTIIEYRPGSESIGRFQKMCDELISIGKERGYI